MSIFSWFCRKKEIAILKEEIVSLQRTRDRLTIENAELKAAKDRLNAALDESLARRDELARKLDMLESEGK